MDIVFKLLFNLKDTPVPSLFIIFGGITFMLALIKVKEIDVPNKPFVGLIGIMMLGIGICLYAVPTIYQVTNNAESSTVSPSTQTDSNNSTLDVVCNASGSIPPLPDAPPNGCILIVDWWIPPKATPCGILLTRQAPSISADAIGTWWYVYPNRPDSALQEFLAKTPYCTVQDLR